MNTMYHWELVPLETPKVEKNCSRCANAQFECSEKFRINSCKKITDVWLIYKCTNCDYTWKMDIIVRKNVSNIDPNLLVKFQENDRALAWHYAFNKNTLGNNKVQVNWNIPFSFNGCTEELLETCGNPVTIILKSEYELGISIRKVLQKILPFSNKHIERLIEEGVVVVNSERKPLSKKIGSFCKVEIKTGCQLSLA